MLSKNDLENFSLLNNDRQKKVFKHFYRSYYNFVNSTVRNHYSTEDILQEAFIRIIGRDLTKINENKLKPWLLTVTRNTTLNYIRKYRRDSCSVNIDDIINKLHDSNNIAEYMKLKSLLHDITELPLKLRETIYLRVVKQLSYKEIANILMITEGSVKQNIYRARKIIQNNY
ncbi:RNA polymerase sigma factor, partial [Paenibacillus macerans]